MLQLDDLRRLRSPAALADVYHLLGYPTDPDAPAFTPAEIGLEGAAATDVTRLWMLADMGDLQHVHFEVRDLHAATLRRVTEQFLRRPGEYLLTFAPAQFDRLVFVKPRRERYAQDEAEAHSPRRSSLKLGKLSVQPPRPRQHDLSVLREIALGGSHPDPYEAHRQQIAAFNVERVTRRFFDEYKRLFHAVRERIAAENPGVQIGPLRRNLTTDQASLHAFTQQLLGRIIFLYFIQKKGWLDSNPDFLAGLYRRATEQEGGNFYRDALEPLFFEVLNTERSGQQSRFGDIPYLNGSLFEREYPATTVLNLPNSLFDPKHAGSILNVLGGYNFTGIPQARLLPLTADDSDPYDLTTAEAVQIIAALKEVRVLDPAVGTASMLVGFLNAMIRVRRSAEAKRGIHAAESSPALAAWKREYIQHSLYGVDIKQEAIEIARLRLWLSLVVDAQEPEPLPNLVQRSRI